MNRPTAYLLIITGGCILLMACAVDRGTQRLPRAEVDRRILTMLSMDRHLPKPMWAAALDSDDFPQYIEQQDAIRLAGSRRLIQAVPNLIWYLDYPCNVTAAISWSLSGPTVENMRTAWCAFDAILNMSEPAIPPLRQFVEDLANPPELRCAAFEVLRVMDARVGEATGRKLSAEFARRGQTHWVDYVEKSLARAPNFTGVHQPKLGEAD